MKPGWHPVETRYRCLGCKRDYLADSRYTEHECPHCGDRGVPAITLERRPRKTVSLL